MSQKSNDALIQLKLENFRQSHQIKSDTSTRASSEEWERLQNLSRLLYLPIFGKISMIAGKSKFAERELSQILFTWHRENLDRWKVDRKEKMLWEVADLVGLDSHHISSLVCCGCWERERERGGGSLGLGKWRKAMKTVPSKQHQHRERERERRKREKEREGAKCNCGLVNTACVGATISAIKAHIVFF